MVSSSAESLPDSSRELVYMTGSAVTGSAAARPWPIAPAGVLRKVLHSCPTACLVTASAAVAGTWCSMPKDQLSLQCWDSSQTHNINT